jgi:ABC-type branched-subunit amino acid transport system ATPase component
MMALLEVQDLRKSFAGVHAVDGVSFSVQSGSITGLIGPNGSGKSTTIDCVSGFQPIDAGRIVLSGVDVTGRAPQRVARAGLMRTFQTVRVYERLSLRDNLMIAAQQFDDAGWVDELLRTARYRRAVSAAQTRARELIDLVGLARYIDAEAGILSYGQKKLVALAAALMPRPKIVVLDEPVAGVEHNVEFITNLCHHVIVLDQGRKLAEGTAAEVHRDARVLEAYLGVPPEMALAEMEGAA